MLLRPPAVGVIAAVLAAACGPGGVSVEAQDSQAIIGGTLATAADAPSAGAMLIDIPLISSGSFICSGTLIAPDVVLTAAHCVDDAQASLPGTQTYFTFDLDVSAFGVTSNTLPAGSILVKKMVRDAAYNPLGMMTGLGDMHDLGVLFLSTPVTNVTPEVMADVNDGPFIVMGASVTIAGYGTTTATGMAGGVKEIATTVLNEIGPAEMQVGTALPVPQKCHGDSGGPTYLVINDGRLPAERLIGATSRAYSATAGCMMGGVDTRVDAHWNWIAGQMMAACQDGTRSGCVDGGAPAVPTAALTDGGEPDAGPEDAGTEGMDGGPALDAGAQLDAGSPMDAGAMSDDAGAPPMDGGTPGQRDGGANPAPDGGSSQMAPQGCGCAAPGASPLLLIAVLLGAARRRTRPSGCV